MSNFSAISWREQVIFDEMMMMMSALYLTNSLSCIFIVLAHKCKHNSPVGRHGVQLEHIGVSNVAEEYVVKNFDRTEFLAMLGLFGSLINGVQL
jgi:hypothetical protein